MLNKVLCIEDDAITLMLTRHILINAKFAKAVISAKDGKEALEVFERASPDEIALVLLDLNMPVKNGWEFLDEFVASYGHRHPATKVIVVSSSVYHKDFEKAKTYDLVLDFISKPLTTNHLDLVRKRLAPVQ